MISKRLINLYSVDCGRDSMVGIKKSPYTLITIGKNGLAVSSCVRFDEIDKPFNGKLKERRYYENT